MYAPDQLNSGHKSNPIYRSSVAPQNDEHHQHKHHHQHENADYHDADLSISNIQITPSALMSMCPALLVQIEQGSCSDPTSAPIQQRPTARKEIKEISSFGKFAIIVIRFDLVEYSVSISKLRFSLNFHRFKSETTNCISCKPDVDVSVLLSSFF